jgi:copper chaperone CopZ
MKTLFSTVLVTGLIVLIAGCTEEREPVVATNDEHADVVDQLGPEPEPAATLIVDVDGMHCTGCSQMLASEIQKMPGVLFANVSFDESRAYIGVTETGPTAEQVVQAIRDTSDTYDARPAATESAEPDAAAAESTTAS